MSERFDLQFHLNENWNIDWECADGDGDAINLTSATLEFKMKYGSTTVMTRTLGDGITVSDAASGLCAIAVTPAHQTPGSVMAGRTYKWQFKVTDQTGVPSVQGHGNLYVKETL